MVHAVAIALAIAGLTTPTVAFVSTPATWFKQQGARTTPVREVWTEYNLRHRARNVAVDSRRSAESTSRLSGLWMKKDSAAEDGDPRRQALDGVLHQIERCYGRGSILKMSDTTSMNVETSSTGEREMDIASRIQTGIHAA